MGNPGCFAKQHRRGNRRKHTKEPYTYIKDLEEAQRQRDMAQKKALEEEKRRIATESVEAKARQEEAERREAEREARILEEAERIVAEKQLQQAKAKAARAKRNMPKVHLPVLEAAGNNLVLCPLSVHGCVHMLLW